MKMVRVGKKVWTGEEEVKLSKLLVTFWQRHGCLPPVGAYGFWKAVKDRLQRFSIKQIQRKLPTLRKRHLRIFSGDATRGIKPHEAETHSIWVKMIGCGDDEQNEEDDVAPAVGRGGTAGVDEVNEHKEIAHREGTDGMQADADEGHQGLQNEDLGGEHAGYGMGDAGVGVEEGARGGTEEADSSCCVIEEPDEPEDVEEVEEEEEVEEKEEEWQQEEQGWDEAAECNSTQDNHHAPRQEEAPPSNPKQELQMLSCVTMADLASAVRTLAEIIAHSHPIHV